MKCHKRDMTFRDQLPPTLDGYVEQGKLVTELTDFE